jgi:hypothetical protein
MPNETELNSNQDADLHHGHEHGDHTHDHPEYSGQFIQKDGMSSGNESLEESLILGGLLDKEIV